MPRHGDIREDGYIYRGTIVHKNGTRSEQWLSPEAWGRYMEGRKKYRENNQEKIRLKKQKHYFENRVQIGKRAKAYARNNPHKILISNARSRVRRRNATPTLTKDQRALIDCLYLTRQRISKCIGVVFHVDHIIPVVKGGLHTPSNLQILPGSINQRKSAKIIYPL